MAKSVITVAAEDSLDDFDKHLSSVMQGHRVIFTVMGKDSVCMISVDDLRDLERRLNSTAAEVDT